MKTPERYEFLQSFESSMVHCQMTDLPMLTVTLDVKVLVI